MAHLLRSLRTTVVPKGRCPRRSFISLPQGDEAKVVGGIIGLNLLVFGGWKYAENYGRSSELKFMKENFTISRALVLNRPHSIITSAFSHQVLNKYCHFCVSMSMLV